MPTRKTLKRRNAKRRTLKRYRNKKKKGGVGVSSILNTIGTTLGIVSPYKDYTYISAYDGEPHKKSSLENFLSSPVYINNTSVLAFPQPEYSKGTDKFIYKDKKILVKLEDLKDENRRFSNKIHPNVKQLVNSDQVRANTNKGTKYIYLAYYPY